MIKSDSEQSMWNYAMHNEKMRYIHFWPLCECTAWYGIHKLQNFWATELYWCKFVPHIVHRLLENLHCKCTHTVGTLILFLALKFLSKFWSRNFFFIVNKSTLHRPMGEMASGCQKTYDMFSHTTYTLVEIRVTQFYLVDKSINLEVNNSTAVSLWHDFHLM